MEKDPVCGMDVDPKTATQKAEQGGKTFYFCGRSCMLEFRDDPDTWCLGGNHRRPEVPE